MFPSCTNKFTKSAPDSGLISWTFGNKIKPWKQTLKSILNLNELTKSLYPTLFIIFAIFLTLKYPDSSFHLISCMDQLLYIRIQPDPDLKYKTYKIQKLGLQTRDSVQLRLHCFCFLSLELPQTIPCSSLPVVRIAEERFVLYRLYLRINWTCVYFPLQKNMEKIFSSCTNKSYMFQCCADLN